MRISANSKPRTASGMTLIELLMTLSIAAIVIALLSSGDFSKFILDARMWLSTSNVQGNFQLAKSEAVTRNINVVLCASSNASSDNPSCSGTANNGWKDGFIMCADINPENDTCGDLEKPLRVGDKMPGQTITAPSHYVFFPDGTVEGK